MNRLFCCIVAVLGFIKSLNAQHAVVQSLLNDARLDSLTTFVKQLTGQYTVIINGQVDTIRSRHFQDPGNEKAFQFLKEQFIRYGYQVDSLQYSVNGKDLFAIKQGYRYPGRKLMLGAHYDNLPAQRIAQGADDNASGSATVLEAGRIFRNYTFPYTIIFALWDEEEPGLIGSNAYVATLGNTDTLMGYVNVDMLGWDGNNDSVADINTRTVALSPAFANRSAYCNSVYNIGLNTHILNPGEESSDQAAFWNDNFTAIGIGEEHHTNFYPYWHTAGDSLIHFNLSFYKKCSKLAYATIADCAIDTVNIVGIKEIGRSINTLDVYPNPFVNNVVIRNELGFNPTVRVVVFDVEGKCVYEKEHNSSAIDIALPELSPGVYSLLLYSGDTLYSKKLVKR